mgnify:CR=1 FL=1
MVNRYKIIIKCKYIRCEMIESFLAVAETGNFTKAAESGKLDLIFTIRDSVKNVKFERRSQSDCVHEQVAKADCECPLYKQRT